jgi:hypothetical protein
MGLLELVFEPYILKQGTDLSHCIQGRYTTCIIHCMLMTVLCLCSS